nr:hypothetical protein [Tanacetum cinerariifolium]
MLTQQDIYAAGSENCPHMLNKENYVPWSSRLLWYAKSRTNGKLIHNSIINGPYTDDELTDKELTKIKADDQAIQTILLGLLEDIYAAVDSCETAQEIWFTSTDGESIESYYHRFLKLVNDLKRNKHFPEKISSNLKFLNNLQPEWSRHVTIVHQTKDLHTADYTQLYDFLKYNQKECFTKINQNYMQQPILNPEDITYPTTAMNMALALMAKAFKLNYSTPTNNNQRISSNPRNRQITQPGMNMGQDRQMQMVRGNGGKQFRQYTGQDVGNLNGYNDVQNVGNQVIQNAVQNPRIQNVRNQNGLIVVSRNANQNLNGNGNLIAARAKGNATGHNGNQIMCYNYRGLNHFARNCTVRRRRRDATYLQTQLLIAQKEEAGIQLQAEEFDLMAATADLDEIKEVNANCILMANLQQASTLGTQTDKAPVYDSDGSAEQMMKGSDIGIQEKKAKLFNEWERFTSTDGESIESYYHRFLKLMNDLKRNKHFTEKIASNLKFLNNLKPEWSRHITIVHQTKDLHTADYTQLYDFLKYNQKEVDELKAERLAKTQDPLALMATSNNPYNFPNPRVQNIRNQNGLTGVPGNVNQNRNGNLVAARAEGNATGQNGNHIRCYNYRGVGHFARNCTVRPKRRDVAYLQTQLLITQKEKAGIQLQSEEFDLMAAAADLDEIEEVNANYILMVNLQQALTSEEQYTKLFEPISESHQVPWNDDNVISEVTSVEQSGGTVEQHPVNVEETRVLYDSLYHNLAIEVEKVNTVNRKLKETNAELTTEFANLKIKKSVLKLVKKNMTNLKDVIKNLNKQLSKEKSTVSFLLEEKKKLKSDFKIQKDELLDK